ncbi:MAG: envelope stress response membrane protein PspB [Novosphingobium sp.]|jgi:phage shock protein B
MGDLIGLIVVISIFIVMPAMFFVHQLLKWKTGSSLSRDDEVMLEELYQVARRLDERLDTVERLVAADNPDFKPDRIRADLDIDNQALDELDRLRARKERTAR